MNKNWVTGCIVLAILIISLASLSSATCPWFIRNELYSAQCGASKVVPASAGILANDPGAGAVLNPEGISIDPKYGTIEVEADGSFVYNPSPNIQSGTYVTFQYNATNDACQATYPGTAKIQVSCKCSANVMDVTVCMPEDLDEVKAMLVAAGAGCRGCGDNTPVFDLSLVKLQPGTYPYLLKCQYCAAATGLVTITGMCQVNAPDFTFCEGTVTLAELTEMIKANAACTGSGCIAPTIDTSDVEVVDGFVSGGSYTATCGAGTDCEDTATGIITLVPKCIVDLIGMSTGCSTPAEVEAQIEAENPSPCGDCDTTPVFHFPIWPLRPDGSGIIADGLYTYTVTCNSGGLAGCNSSGAGEVLLNGICGFCPCIAVAKDVMICEGDVTLDKLVDDILPGNASCTSTIGTGCDVTPEIDTDNVIVDGNGFVTGGTYTATCRPIDDCLPVTAIGNVIARPCDIRPCEASAPGVSVCTDG